MLPKNSLSTTSLMCTIQHNLLLKSFTKSSLGEFSKYFHHNYHYHVHNNLGIIQQPSSFLCLLTAGKQQTGALLPSTDMMVPTSFTWGCKHPALWHWALVLSGQVYSTLDNIFCIYAMEKWRKASIRRENINTVDTVYYIVSNKNATQNLVRIWHADTLLLNETSLRGKVCYWCKVNPSLKLRKHQMITPLRVNLQNIYCPWFFQNIFCECNDALPPMMLCGFSALARRIFGPNTVAKFWTFILLLLEQFCTSFRNLRTHIHYSWAALTKTLVPTLENLAWFNHQKCQN